MLPALVVVVLAFGLGAVLPVAVRPILEKLKMVDTPTERSSHTVPTYRGMGLATAVAVCLSFGAATVAGWTINPGISVTLLLGMIVALVLGWVEDVRGVKIAVRAGAQLVIGAGVALFLAVVMDAPLLWVVPAAVFVAGYINVANFMDGINGISGFHGLVAGLCYAYTGYLTGLPWLSLGGLAVAGAFAAFLPWNVRSGRNVFLGDAGSYVLGASLAVLAVGAWFARVSLLVAVAPLAVYLADAGTTLVRRFAAGEQWYKPHRTHVYQRLTDVGFSHLGATAVVTSATVLVWTLVVNGAAFMEVGSWVLGLGLLLLAVLFLMVYLRLPVLMSRPSGSSKPGRTDTPQNESDTTEDVS